MNENNNFKINYSLINECNNTPKVWTNNFRGSIVKSIYDPKTDHIYQYCIPYNRIENYKNYFNKEINKNNDFSSKIVNRNLQLLNEID